MTVSRHPIEVWIVMDESGNYVVAADEDTASAQVADELNEDEDQRYVTLKIDLGTPNENVVAAQTINLTID